MLFLSMLLVMSLPFLSYAQPAPPSTLEPVVVTATRIETPLEQVSASVTVITRQEIEERQLRTVEEALRGLPGMAVVRQGSAGSQTSIFLRGANSDHALVLIDGLRVSSSITGGFDFADLTTDNIERIEVIRGPQSALYGSDAIAGVVNIITRRGAGRPSHLVSLGGGNHGTFRGQLASAGAFGPADYSVGISRLQTRGFLRHDDYRNTSLSASLGFRVGDEARFGLFGRFADAEKDLPPVKGRSFDPNERFGRRFFQVGSAWEQRVAPWLDYSLRVGVSGTDSDFSDPADSVSPSFTFSRIDATVLNVDGQVTFRPLARAPITVGAEWMDHSADFSSRSAFGASRFDKAVTNGAAFAHSQLALLDGRLVLSGGGRYDDHSRFGQATTWQLSSGFLVRESGTKLKASWGSAFKAPDLADLFFPGFANPDLKPERARGFEVGIEQSLWRDRLRAEAVYFDKRLRNLIQFDPASLRPENVGRASIRGVELPITLQLRPELKVRWSYSLVETEDEETGARLIRRPKDTFAAQVSYSFLERFTATLEILHVRNRKDIDFAAFPSRRVTLEPYTKVDLGLSATVARGLSLLRAGKVRAKIENLFNQKYEEAFGFPAPGALFLIALEGSF